MTTAIENPAFSMFKAELAVSYVRPYSPKDAIDVSGFRHSVIRYRDTTKGVAVKPAKVVTIPVVTLPDANYLMPDDAKKVLIGVIEDQQDILVRDAIEQGANSIEWNMVSLDNSLKALTAVRVSQRLTKEQIVAWVSVALSDVLAKRAEAISMAKIHTELQRQVQLAATKQDYSNALGTLSAPVPNLKQQSAIACKNLLIQANIQDDISKALLAKLEAILNPEIASENL